MPISGISTHTCENKAEADWVSTRTSVVSTLESREHAGYARWSNIVSSSPPRRRDSGPFVVSCGSPYIACKPRAAYLVLKDAIRLLILLEILTSSGDVGSKYWSRMRRKVLNCSSEPLGTWHQRKQRDARQEVSHTYVCGDERKTPLSRSSLVVRSFGESSSPQAQTCCECPHFLWRSCPLPKSANLAYPRTTSLALLTPTRRAFLRQSQQSTPFKALTISY